MYSVLTVKQWLKRKKIEDLVKKLKQGDQVSIKEYKELLREDLKRYKEKKGMK